MSSDYDPTEFVDGDFQTHKAPYSVGSSTAGQLQRAPTREEVDSKVAEAQQKLTELRRAQEELERQRAGLEETRRRQMEFQTGRQEMIQNLSRALGLFQQAQSAGEGLDHFLPASLKFHLAAAGFVKPGKLACESVRSYAHS